MVLVDDVTYKETIEILRDKKRLSPFYCDLKKWLGQRFGITAYNFVFQRIPNNNPKGRFKLYILLSSTRDYNSMCDKRHCGYDKNKQDEISQEFEKLADMHNFGNPETIKDVWVCYNDFSIEMKTGVNRLTYKKINKYIWKKYRNYSLWGVYPLFTDVVVFFMRDEDILRNSKNGVCANIQSDYFKALKESDEFGLYNPVNFTMRFDSKENLDNNYEGNLYYYFK